MTFVESHLAGSGRKSGQIKLHGPDDFEGMRLAGRVTAEALDMLVPYVKPGVTTKALDDLVFDFAIANGAYPAPLDYRGYRKSICTSINHVVCHGIPDDKPLREGDIVNVDVTFIIDGWHGDSSRMFAVGEVPRRAQRLIDVTYESLMRGIAVVKPGRDDGRHRRRDPAIRRGRALLGGARFLRAWARPAVPRRAQYSALRPPGQGVELRPGMFFTIEPMINLGRPQVKVLGDGWTAVTRDRSLSAQFEHSLGVTETGVEIFTASPAGLDNPSRPMLAGRAAAPNERAARPRRRPDGETHGLREGAAFSWPQRSGCATVSSRRARSRSPITNCWNSCSFARYRAATSSRWPRR